MGLSMSIDIFYMLVTDGGGVKGRLDFFRKFFHFGGDNRPLGGVEVGEPDHEYAKESSSQRKCGWLSADT